MADNNQPTEWYLARDGQQYGPVTDAELSKIIELGHLKPTDLVWRQGMDDWAPAESTLDLRPKSAPPPPRVEAPQPPNRRPPVYPQPNAQPATAQQPGGDRARPAPSAGGAPAGGAGATYHPGSAERGPAAPGPGYGGGAQRPTVGQPAGADPRGYPGHHAGTDPRAIGHGAPAPHASSTASDHLDDQEPPARRRLPWRAVAVLVVVAGLAATVLALHRSGKLAGLPLLSAPSGSRTAVPVVPGPSNPAREAMGASSQRGPAGNGAAGEQAWQQTPLWQQIRRDFPEWYAQRVIDVNTMASESKSKREIELALVRSLVELRRKYQQDALSASPTRLRAIATSFVATLSGLAKDNSKACFGFISQGEASRDVLDLEQADHRTAIESQLATVFDAVVEGRQAPMKRDPPKREDYDALSIELSKRGWTTADLQLFTDARALARAPHEKVCQMVQDWFAAQLTVPDEQSQARLLGEALKPVVAG
jgi:hypothetical protein